MESVPLTTALTATYVVGAGNRVVESRATAEARTSPRRIVVNGPIADRRRVFLENLGVAVVVVDGDDVATAIGQLAQEWFGRAPFQAHQSAEV